jgi:phage terminase Nu1 subunit (DNA packaging protein)
MDDEIPTARLAQLFSVTPKTIADLGKRDIIVKGKKRGSWLLWDSVSGYVKHLREEAAARGGEEVAQARADPTCDASPATNLRTGSLSCVALLAGPLTR